MLVLPEAPLLGGQVGVTIDGVGVIMGTKVGATSQFTVPRDKVNALKALGSTLSVSLGGTGPENGKAYSWQNEGATIGAVVKQLGVCRGYQPGW